MAEMGIVEERMIRFYSEMLKLRYFEESIADLYRRGLVPSSAHLYIGQEAVATGVCVDLRREDYVLTTHRGHAHNIVKGAPMDRVAAEILGKATGLCKGRGGSMRVTCVDEGILYACPIVGSNIPIAAGVGLQIKMRGGSQVVACFFGEGATNIGDFHEGLNLASLWELPVIFVCENNVYGLSVSMKRATTVEDVAERAAGYNMPGVVVDGNDVVEVYGAAKRAVERARRGGGPTLMECKTYRWLGHHVGDPGTAYRSKEEVEAWKEKCPIKRQRRRLLGMGVREEDLHRIEKDVEDEVGEAIKYALDSPYPSPEELKGDVFRDG